MIRTYEASVLSVEPRGDHQVATLRVQGLGTLAIEVGTPHDPPIRAGDVRTLAVTMEMGDLLRRDEQPADHR